MKIQWQKLFSYLKISEVTSSTDGVFMKEEDIDKTVKLHEDFIALQEMHTTLEQTAKDAQTAQRAAEDEVAGLQSTIDDLNTKLGGKPEEEVVVKNTGGEGSAAKMTWQQKLAALPHNQAADKKLSFLISNKKP